MNIFDKNEENTDFEASTSLKLKNKAYFLIILFFWFAGLILLVIFMPESKIKSRENLSVFPHTTKELQEIKKAFKEYANSNYIYSVLLFVYVYIFLQSMAIPGPIFLSIISGMLWNFSFGFLISNTCATIGASMCYLISQNILKDWVFQKWPKKVRDFRLKTQQNKRFLFLYMLFLRITPFVPNILVNLFSPIAGIPLNIFFFGTFIGLLPLNYIHVNSGRMIDEIDNIGLKSKHLFGLCVLGLLAFLPTIIFRNSNSKTI